MVTRPPLLPSNKSMLSFRWQRPWETRRGILYSDWPSELARWAQFARSGLSA